MSWRWLAGVSSCFPLLSSIFLAFIPESPSWLVTQGRLEQARASLTWLRGNNYDIEEEFAKLKESYTKTQMKGSAESVNLAQKGKHLVRQLSRPDVFKPLLLVNFLMLLQQFTGIATTTYYAVELLGDGKYLDKYSATIIYGFIRWNIKTRQNFQDKFPGSPAHLWVGCC